MTEILFTKRINKRIILSGEVENAEEAFSGQFANSVHFIIQYWKRDWIEIVSCFF